MYSHIDRHWCAAGFFISADLPWVNGQIDVKCVTNKLKAVGWRGVCYLQCCAFQRAFALFEQWVVRTVTLCDQVITVAKTLLQCSIARILSLDNWLAFLHILPLEIPQLEKFFHRMYV